MVVVVVVVVVVVGIIVATVVIVAAAAASKGRRNIQMQQRPLNPMLEDRIAALEAEVERGRRTTSRRLAWRRSWRRITVVGRSVHGAAIIIRLRVMHRNNGRRNYRSMNMATTSSFMRNGTRWWQQSQ